MCSTRAYVVRGVRVPITSSALKSNNAATFPVLPSFHIKKNIGSDILDFMCIYYRSNNSSWMKKVWFAFQEANESLNTSKPVCFDPVPESWVKNPLLQHSWPTSAQGTFSDKIPSILLGIPSYPRCTYWGLFMFFLEILTQVWIC